MTPVRFSDGGRSAVAGKQTMEYAYRVIAAKRQIGIWRTVRTCHSEPARTLVWESPSTFEYLIVIQTVLSHRFPEFVHEKWCFYPGDCHASLRTGSQ